MTLAEKVVEQKGMLTFLHAQLVDSKAQLDKAKGALKTPLEVPPLLSLFFLFFFHFFFSFLFLKLIVTSRAFALIILIATSRAQRRLRGRRPIAPVP